MRVGKKMNFWMVLGIIVFIGLILYGIPKYHVYTREMGGKAQLREAEWSRKILIEEAEAKRQSASLLAQAEIERAKGVAEANKIISTSINEEYLRYLWIQGLHDGSSEVIYVATEAGLPILEANRFK